MGYLKTTGQGPFGLLRLNSVSQLAGLLKHKASARVKNRGPLEKERMTPLPKSQSE